MLCRVCKENAEVSLRSHNTAFCRAHFLDFFYRRVEKTIRYFNMINKNEGICVSISGGKDSLALALCLKELGYKISGYHIDLGFDNYSDRAVELVKKFGEGQNIDLKIESVVDLLGISMNSVLKKFNRNFCSVCGKIKRYMMNKAGLSYDAIVTGHNLDDEVSTLFGNIAHWNIEYLARQYPYLEGTDNLVRKIKPFVFTSEREIAVYAFFKDIEHLNEPCPFFKGATSRYYKYSLNMLEKYMPATKIYFLKKFYKNRALFKLKEHSLTPCKFCGYLTTADICSVCRIK
ncbi:MAG: ATP-binding protein, partial [bacterium]